MAIVVLHNKLSDHVFLDHKERLSSGMWDLPSIHLVLHNSGLDLNHEHVDVRRHWYSRKRTVTRPVYAH